MSKMPLISIITVNLNDLEGLKRTMKSVFEQTWTDFEYIVIDGGSTDGSKQLIEENKDRIDHWVSEQDSGIYSAMNKGIKMASGEYLLFLNSGDHFIEKNVLEFNQKSLKRYDIIYFNLNMVKEELGKTANYPKKLRFSYFVNDTLPHPATFIKNSLFSKVGHYDESLKIVSDWKFFIECICKYNCSYKKVENILTTYYLDGISSIKENEKIIFEERRKVLNENFPLFLEDYKELVEVRQKLNSKRMQAFSKLENKPLPRRINSLLFKLFTTYQGK